MYDEGGSITYWKRRGKEREINQKSRYEERVTDCKRFCRKEGNLKGGKRMRSERQREKERGGLEAVRLLYITLRGGEKLSVYLDEAANVFGLPERGEREKRKRKVE